MEKQTKMKTHLSYEEQIYKLENGKKLVIDNKQNALKILKQENYYRLSGYFPSFLDKNDVFIKGTKFEDIYNIYNYDKNIRSSLFELVCDIEVYFKTQISHYMGEKYGPLGYMNINNYDKKYEKEVIALIKKIEETLSKNTKNPIVAHHNHKYNGKIPIWACLELMTFGCVSKMYSYLNVHDQKEIQRQGFININAEVLKSYLHTVAYFRNYLCHHNRLFRSSHTIRPTEYKIKTKDTLDIKILSSSKTNFTFYYILVMLLLNPNENLGKRAIENIKTIFEKSKSGIETDYGFPKKINKKQVFQFLYKYNSFCIKK